MHAQCYNPTGVGAGPPGGTMRGGRRNVCDGVGIALFLTVGDGFGVFVGAGVLVGLGVLLLRCCCSFLSFSDSVGVGFKTWFRYCVGMSLIESTK